jgi:hypothetical protein
MKAVAMAVGIGGRSGVQRRSMSRIEGMGLVVEVSGKDSGNGSAARRRTEGNGTSEIHPTRWRGEIYPTTTTDITIARGRRSKSARGSGRAPMKERWTRSNR